MSDSDSRTLPTFTVTSATVTEGSDRYALFYINLSEASGVNTLLGLSLNDGTAKGDGVDFGHANQDQALQVSLDGLTWVDANTVVIPAGSTVAKVRTLITDDAAVEAQETFELVADLIGGRAENLQAVGTCTILDNDAAAQPTLSIGNITVTEGADRFATFTVSLDKPSSVATALNLKLEGIEARAYADFSTGMQWSADGKTWQLVSTFRQPTIAAGTTRIFVRNAVFDDGLIEKTESFQLTATTSNANLANTTATGKAAIIDNDCAKVRIYAPEVYEGSDRFAVFHVNLTKRVETEAVKFDFRFEDGTATSGVDFARAGSPFGHMQVSVDEGRTWVTSTCATFAPGQTHILVRTTIVNDSIREGREDFKLIAQWEATSAIDGTQASGQALIFDGGRPSADPLVLDLDGNGVQSLSRQDGVQFDHDGDGVRSATGWVGKGDGLLAIDLDGDGAITSGRELFGDRMLTPGGGEASDGFAALAQHDSNHDGRVDASDANFGQLRVWEDANANGVSEEGELSTLAQRGIESLSLDYTAVDVRQNGNAVTMLGSYRTADGKSGQLSEYWFASEEAKPLDLRDLLAPPADAPLGAAPAPAEPAAAGGTGAGSAASAGVAGVYGHQYLEDNLRHLMAVKEQGVCEF